ncbi:non-ribosomal peptide synthetase nps2 [Fusarium piperis]|uniref:Non-ribosomal peptide synthetase nps2 n=1 Tax=Fusarium piperis TaxID=1435070 RepID=A0A9W8W3Y8_9HYPO|nr:non-ribosomal peptide synthetase nps2 [Fusarium piperis]
MDATGLSILNLRASRLPGPNLLHQLVKSPSQQTALDYMSNNRRHSYTYRQLHDAADALARRITHASGSQNGQLVVPVLIHQSPLLYISLLAILKAGGAFCPLNIDAPPERVKFILGDVAASVVLVSKELASGIPHDVSATVITVDGDTDITEPSQVDLQHRIPQPEDLAYVMYTSGSTGTPKGVGISHDAATQALLAHDRHIPPFSRFLQFAAPTFDVSVFEIFFPLFRGVTLVTVRRVEMLNDLPAVLRSMDVDACELTPTVAGSLLRERENAPNLKVLLTIGEMLNAPVVEEFGGDDSKPSMLWAMYGPTEATIHCSLQTAFSCDSSTGNIGVPLDSVSCFIIEIPETEGEDFNLKVLPQGEVGELAVGGYQLATGYINRPEQTRSVFIDSPYGRIYRTGDKARLLPNGKLECFGRLSDGQVKLRGQRLELGEVEQAVLRTSGCHSAVAAVVNSILVVFCAVDAGVSEDAILKKCGDWLPQYMVPGEVVLMSEFPRLPSGKVDRKRLKAEHEVRKANMAEDSQDSGPADATETKILGVVSEVLNFKAKKSMSLASAGLDSLKAIKLASALRKSGVAVDSVGLLMMKTISDIISTARRQAGVQATNSLPKEATITFELASVLRENPVLGKPGALVEDVLSCTPLQAAMLAETAQNPTAYCNEIALEIPKGYTIEEISESFVELTRRNAILRAGFTTFEGKFVMVLFKDLRPEQIKSSDRFQQDFSLSSPQDYLNPLRIQIQHRSSACSSRLLLHLHHSIYDGWSMDILLSDWSKLLLKERVPQHLPFRDVVEFYSNPQTNDASRVFWTEHLLGWNRIPLPKLQGKAIDSKQISSSRRQLVMPRQLVDAEIQKLGCTPQVLFQASLVLLWSGIMGTRDVSIGSVTSGRTIPVAGIENIIGPCIASLPLRADLDTMTANLDLLNSIHSANRKVMQHCTISLSEIKKLAGLQPGESLYDALFVYQESLNSSERAFNAVRETSHLDRLETPILFEVEPTDDAFSLQITYQTAFSSSKTVEHMMDQLESLVSLLLKNPHKDIKWTQRNVTCDPSIDNTTPASPQPTLDLAGAFEQAASRNPGLAALVFAHTFEEGLQQTTMSFQELNDLANQISWYLQDRGVKAGQVVAIIMDKSPRLYASILGIAKCGCGYLPILPFTPSARIQEVLSQAEVEHFVVDNGSLDQVIFSSGSTLINIDNAALTAFPTANPGIPPDGSRLAYVIYTSGTTGTPKGVAVEQYSIMANIEFLGTLYPRPSNSQGRLLQTCSQAFDVSVFEIFYTWYTGMCLCAGTNDTIFEDLERSIRDLGITHLSMTPTVASLVDPRNTPGIEFLVTAGEPMSQSVFDRWQQQLWQGYGPSEMTNICTIKKMAVGDHIENLGHVFPNTSVVLLFPESYDTAPLNWVGEFCFGGAQVAQGYLNMPNLTSEKFIQHPKYGRLYRSGDMGRMLSDGSLMILGRIDDQVKLRGQRIETGEINSVATSTSLASSAVTLLVRREKGAAEQLALFFVPQNDPSAFRALEVDAETQQSLIAHLYSRLPAYMVPSYSIPISTVPLTSSGKVDKRKLRACFEALDQEYLEAASKSSLGAQDDGDWSETELAIAEAIMQSAKVLRDEFGRWTPFTVLGIDSISAIDLGRALNLTLETRVAVSEILRNPTIAQLAHFISQNAPSQEHITTNSRLEFFPPAFVNGLKEVFAKESKVVKAILPCTPLQEAMLSRGQRGYYNKVLLRLGMDSLAIKSYWETMAERHDILRTCFETTTDSQRAIAQIVLDGWNIPWMTLDVNQLSFDGAIEEHLRTLPDPVDSRTPPVSLALLRYRGSEFLSFICHHALYDGVAMERLLKEVEALAGGAELPPPVSYSEFLAISTNLPSDTEQFWLQHFQGYRPSTLFAQPTTSEMDQSTHTTSLDLPLTELQARLRDLGTTLLSICQASWATVLAMVYRRPDVCFGNVVSGRTLNMEGLDRLVAPCFNTIPVRADFTASWSNLDLVKHLQKLNAELLAYQFTPLRLVQRTVNRTGKHLFDTLLLLQKPLQDIEKDVWTLEGDSGDMDIPLVCEVVPCPSLNSLVINLHRDMSIVPEEIATAMADVFKLMLRAILHSPHATLMDRSSLPGSLHSVFNLLEPRQERTEITVSSSSEEEWSDLELKVCQVLATLSGVSERQIHRRTTIFQLGLDSINAVQVASILRQQGFAISASDVIECPSCSKIAAKLLENSSKAELEDAQEYNLEQFSRQVSEDVAKGLPGTAEIEAILPCTPVQSAMLASFIQSQGDHYLNAVSYHVSEGMSLRSLETAWAALQERHPMLRTGFVPVNSSDTSFAMVRYTSKSSALPLETLYLGESDNINLLQLKADLGINVQKSLHQPPWAVVLSQSSEETRMNLIMHHALYDAPSLHLMLNDLSQLLGGKGPLPILRVEPAVSAILSKSLKLQASEREFWEAKANQTVVNKFPIMTPLRVEERQVLADTITSALAYSKLQQATQASSITIQAAIQAAWTRVLASYLGENSVVFGVALSGRTADETKDAPFPCLNTVPIVASNVSSNTELVNYMMEYNQHLHKHQFSSLSQVQKWLGHPAGPIFDTLIAYQKMPDTESSSVPWRLVKDEAMVEYPVSLEIEPVQNDQVRLCITYYSDILPQEQAKLLAEQFDASLIHIACDIAGDEDDAWQQSRSLYSVLPATAPTLEAPVQLLHQFVEMGATSHPTKLALEFVSGFNGEAPVKQQWGYQQLDCMANKVANMLHSQATAGSIIAIHFDKCPEAYFSILGILKAGCSFVALDPTAPKARKEFILSDSKAPCLLTTNPETLDFETDATIVKIDQHALEAIDNGQLEFQPTATPSDTCYCLYTSGTTGTPKGCEITHENAVQAMMAFQDLFNGHWDDHSRWLQFAALHFDVSVLEQYWSWSVGIAVVAAPKDLILDDLTATINRLAITHIDLTPSLARLTHPDEVPSLCRGVFITGGEQLKQEILDAWGPKAVIYNAYGPTEATIGVTMFQRVPITGRPSNIGKQFLNVGSFVFRQNTNTPVLRGGVGELCVSGKLVGKGYLNRPELTEERFPTLPEFGERVYRTGDLVRMLHDGCFDFLGRADDQVKLRGQRLEIAEITHTIRTGIDDMQDAATIVTRHGTSGKDVLVSFVVGKQSTKGPLEILQDEEGLGAQAKEICRAKLPGYMVPTYIFSLPYIPLSPNNKAEIKDLKRLFAELSPERLMQLSHASTAPISRAAQDTMHKLLEVIAEFSNVDKGDLSSSTSIFDVGVDSITTLRLSSLLKSRGFKSASPALLLKNPVIGDLANSLAKVVSTQQDKLVREVKQSIRAFGHRYRGLVCRSLGVKPADIEYIAPCSPLQQGIISRSMTNDQRGVYFNTFELNLHQGTSVGLLRRAWEDLIESEAILRTAFVPTTDGFVQASLTRRKFPWREHTLENSELVEGFLAEQNKDWIEQNRSLIRTPLLLTCVETPTSRLLIVHIFHALYDGNSFDLMMDRLAAVYSHRDIPRGSPFLEALSHGPLLRHDSCRQFWEDNLQGWSFTPIPEFGKEMPETAITAVREIPTEGLEAMRSSQNVTLQAVVMALWSSALQRFCLDQPTIGVIVSGRAIGLEDVEYTIGPLFNTVPFYRKAIPQETWTALVRRCHEFNASVLEFQHVSLKNIQKWCSNGKALFDNLFTYQIEPTQEENLAWDVVDGHFSPDYPLALEAVYTRSGKLRFTLVAQGHIATSSKLNEILDEVERDAELMASSPDSEVLSLDFQESPSNGVSLGNALTAPADESKFEWTQEARAIQEEIATLANVATSDVTERVSVLEAGLDSIDVIKLSAKLKKRSISLPPSQIMRCQTIARIITELGNLASVDSPNHAEEDFLENTKHRLRQHLESSGLNLGTVESVLPSTHLQESMVAGMIQSDYESYFNHDVLEVPENVNTDQLLMAWKELVRRTPILRTGFFEIDNQNLEMTYCQVVSKPSDINIGMVALKELSDVNRITSSAKELARSGHGESNLFQLRLATLGFRRLVILSMAHALYDGWSLSLLFQDLQAIYEGREVSQPAVEPFLARISKSDSLEAQEFWMQYLDGASPTLISKQESGSPPATDKLQRREFKSTINLVEINTLCKNLSISLQTLCQACWAITLAHQTRSLDVTFGIIMSGRDFDGADNLAFPTMNTVALRCILHGSPSEFLQYLEENMGDIREFQHYPLRKAQLATSVGGHGLFNTLFILQRSPSSDNDQGQVLLKSVDGSSATEYPICVEAEAMSDALVWRIAYQPQYSLAGSPEQLMSTLDNIMEFLMKSSASDILCFEERGVSICGMSAMTLKDTASLDISLLAEELSDGVEHWDQTSTEIREILHQVSNVPIPSIKLSDSLYHLGLDSISAIKVSSLLRKGGINLRPQDLIKAANISEMGDKAKRASTNGAQVPANSESWVPPKNIDVRKLLSDHNIPEKEVEVLPALPMQVYMLSAWQNAEGSVFYPEFPCRINKSFGVEDIQTAWDSLVSESPLLRTCFIATGSLTLPFLQVILKNHRIPLSTSGPGDEQTDVIEPLVSAHVAEQDGEARLFRLKIHHALYDGVALPSLLQRLSELLQGTPTELNKGFSQWRNFAVSQSTDTARNARKDFWTNYLQDAPLAKEQVESSANIQERVSHLQKSAVSDIAHIRKLASQTGVSIQSLFLAAYAKALALRSDCASTESIVFGMYLANRAVDHDLPPTYPTLNLVPLKVEAPIGQSLTTIAESIQKDIHLIVSNGRADVGLWEISQWTGVELYSFANFLSLPDDIESTENSVRVLPAEALDGARNEPSSYPGYGWLQQNTVRNDIPISRLQFMAHG